MRTILMMLGILLSVSIASAQSYVLNKGHAEVQGRAPGPGGDYTGSSEELEGKININTKDVNFKLNLISLKTGNDKRDRDMNKTLDVAAHPSASFKGKIISSFDIHKEGVQNVTVKGEFNIHGASKEIEVKGTLEKSSNRLNLKASFPVNMTEYGLERPKILTYQVEDKQMIYVNGTLHQENTTVKK